MLGHVAYWRSRGAGIHGDTPCLSVNNMTLILFPIFVKLNIILYILAYRDCMQASFD